MVTAERLRELLHYDRETGVFTRRVTRGRLAKAGARAGYYTSHGYRSIIVDGKRCGEHRLAWLYETGSWPKGEVDHIDGVRTHNWFANLRDVTRLINTQNQREAHSHNQSGFLGVMRNGRKFRAEIRVNKRRLYLGTFETAKEAHDAYLAAKRLHHPGNML